MTDKQHNKFVEDFCNDHSIAIGGGIKVHFSLNNVSYTPVGDGMKYEDINYLKSQMDGASACLFWLRRKGYKIVKK